MELPSLSDDFLLRCHQARDLANYPELATLLPLNQFTFEGLVITRISEVSERETVSTIRSILQKDNSLENPQFLRELEQQLRYLLRRQEAEIGFVAFYDADAEVELPTSQLLQHTAMQHSKAPDVVDFCNHLRTFCSIFLTGSGRQKAAKNRQRQPAGRRTSINKATGKRGLEECPYHFVVSQ
jgi:hypothetical protein